MPWCSYIDFVSKPLFGYQACTSTYLANGWKRCGRDMYYLVLLQDESDANLPKIVPSVFQSPGGDRFCNLMFAFSSYVLSYVIKHEHGESHVTY